MITVVRMIDTIGQNLDRLKGYSYWQQRPVLSYTTRTYAATPAQRAAFRHFFGVDQAPGDTLYGGARVKDVESGGALNSNVANLARAGAKFVAYTFMSNYHAMRSAIDATGHGANVAYWIADWTASESRAMSLLASDPRIVAVQWAAPTFGGGIVVPGTGSTVAQLNVDLSVGRMDFWLPRPKPQAAEGIWRGAWDLDVAKGQWTAHPAPGKNVVRSSEPEEDYAVIGVNLQTGAQRIKGLDRATGARLLK